MKNILVIARNTFKEVMRNRILYAILGFAFMFVLFALYLGTISLGEDIVVMKNVGLAGIYLFGLIITIFVGVSILYKEIELRTLYVILSKPVKRGQVVVGKFLGLLGAVSLTTLLIFIVYLLVVWLKGGGLDWRAFWAVLLQLGELSIFIALTMLFSTFSTSLASIIYAVIVLYIGHSLDLLVKFAQRKGGDIAYNFSLVIYYLFPNLEKLNIRNIAAYSDPLNYANIAGALIYALVYTALVLWAAAIIFNRREL